MSSSMNGAAQAPERSFALCGLLACPSKTLRVRNLPLARVDPHSRIAGGAEYSRSQMRWSMEHLDSHALPNGKR
jgi:hypothetical protein